MINSVFPVFQIEQGGPLAFNFTQTCTPSHRTNILAVLSSFTYIEYPLAKKPQLASSIKYIRIDIKVSIVSFFFVYTFRALSSFHYLCESNRK
jgi:hypothetical protein